MKNCLKMTQIASDSQERKLRPVEKVRLSIHLMVCPGCKAFIQNSETLSKIMQTLKSKEEE